DDTGLTRRAGPPGSFRFEFSRLVAAAAGSGAGPARSVVVLDVDRDDRVAADHAAVHVRPVVVLELLGERAGARLRVGLAGKLAEEHPLAVGKAEREVVRERPPLGALPALSRRP